MKKEIENLAGLFKSEHPLKSFKQIKKSTLGGAVSILGTVHLLLAYLYLPRTSLS